VETIHVTDDATLDPGVWIEVVETIHVTDDATLDPAVWIEVVETIHVADTASLPMSPAAQDGTASVAEDTSTLVSLAATDADGDAFTLMVVGGPAHGTVWPPPGTVMPGGTLVTYTPAPNYFGPDSFLFKATDAQGDSNLATIRIAVTPMPDPPGAAPDGPFVMTAGQTLTIPPPGVLANDADLDGDTLTARLATPPAHGSVNLDPTGGFAYTPAPGYLGPDTFSYVANDGQLDSNAATVLIRVDPAAGREVRTGIVIAGDTLSTDDEGDGATSVDFIETTVLTRQGGAVTIDEGPAPPELPSAFTFLPLDVLLTAPPATASAPLLLTFLLDRSVLPADARVADLAVFRDGVEVPPCVLASAAAPDPCVFQRARAGDDVRLRVRTSGASRWTFGVPRSTAGLATGVLRPRAGGDVAFTVTKVQGQLVGALAYRNRSERFQALRITAFAVEADGHTAWFAGQGLDGRTFLAYAQDRGPADVFRLWIGGVQKTGGGGVAAGDLAVVP
jgi:hypothetical protein